LPGFRVLALCDALAGTESLHGTARTVLRAPRVGKALAIKLSVASGTLLAFWVCYVRVPCIGLTGFLPHLSWGLVALVFIPVTVWWLTPVGAQRVARP
jgi:hypothetical protein